MSQELTQELTLESIYKAYKKGTLVFSEQEQIVFKAILRGREARVLRNKTELSEALYCAIVCCDEDLEKELKWWKGREEN